MAQYFRKNWPLAMTIVLIALASMLVYYKDAGFLYTQNVEINESITQKTFDNYQAQVIKAANKYDVPPEYLLALIALECSGRKIVPHRFEHGIYQKLEKVAQGKLPKLENVQSQQLKNLSIIQLRELASSWGPFQIMGYKSFDIGVAVADLKGPNNIDVGAKWIAKEYGSVLRNKEFKNAFHRHNTGRAYPKFGPPKTYHREYVPRGLAYMDAFKLLLNND